MQRTITSIGRSAARTLLNCSGLHVAATFERCLYLRHGDHFVCIGDASIGDGPLNARSDAFDHSLVHVPVGSAVRSADRCLAFDGYNILTWTGAATWTMPPWPTIGRGPILSRATLKAFLTTSPADGLFRLTARQLLGTHRPAATPLFSRAQTALASLNAGLSAASLQHEAHFKAATLGLIGLGPGLTPSGDDVLAGALLGLHACGRPALAAQLGEKVAAAAVAGTSPLSAAFLRCAIEGETSAPLHKVFSTILANAYGPATLDTLDRIGHTSGWDHLAGFLLALTAVQPRPVS